MRGGRSGDETCGRGRPEPGAGVERLREAERDAAGHAAAQMRGSGAASGCPAPPSAAEGGAGSTVAGKRAADEGGAPGLPPAAGERDRGPARTAPTSRRLLARAALFLLALAAVAALALDRWIATAPLPDLDPAVSVTVLDRDGRLLRAYQVADGRWRLPVDPAEVERGYIAQLLAYEDRRFHRHAGVDPLALARAAWQAVWHGRPISGASTLTMQVARLLTEAPTGSAGGKLAQIRLALALERRLAKEDILRLYLTLAPFGGNIEGVRAAALTWFGKEPRRLTPAEAALLVALPQSPEARRPDRHPEAARAARDRVLARSAAHGALPGGDARAAMAEPVPTARRGFPALAPHLADRIVAARPGAPAHRVTIDAGLQASLEALVAERAADLPPGLSAALVVADHRTGEILASVGSPGLTDAGRSGWIDMTEAVRSPGSTLKPLIYGLAFELGLAHPESLIEDRPIAFGHWTPANFDGSYHGTVSVREALQRSQNVPAVTLLDAAGPARLLARMRRAGTPGVLPPGGAPGLAIGLGGIGLTLRELVQLYAALARGGEAVMLTADADAAGVSGARVLAPGAAWQLADILAGAPAPAAAPNRQLAFKTGTSYGHRDAWSVGFDGRHVAGVWIGRPDAAAVPGITGIGHAAPLLFQTFSRLKPAPEPLRPPPPDVLTVSRAELPAPLAHVRGPGDPTAPRDPEIVYPPDGARVDLGGGAGGRMALAVKIRDGAPPFTWLVDGAPVVTGGLEREIAWEAPGAGFISIAVIDGSGRAARARIAID